MADAEWEAHKAEIKQLYIEKNWILSRLMQHMASTHGFKKSKKQYETKFKKWDLKKYAMTADNWKVVGYRIKKREREFDKKSTVLINGVSYPQEKVRKEIARHGCFHKKFLSAPSPKTPDGVVVQTPDVVGIPGFQEIQFLGGVDFPWLHFLRAFNQDNSQENIFRAPNNALIVSHPDAASDIVHTLSTMPSTRNSAAPLGAQVAAALKAVMPEESIGHHQETWALLSDSDRAFAESTKIQLFLLSNNFMLAGQIGGRSSLDVEEHDKRVLTTLHLIGYDKLEHFQTLLSRPEETVGAITEQVFASALRSHDLNLIEMMLDAGMDPNIPIENEYFSKSTPVQFAASILRRNHDMAVKMITLLLDRGADVNCSCRDTTALWHSARNGDIQLARFLVGHGAQATGACLWVALRRALVMGYSKDDAEGYTQDYPVVISLLLDSGVDPNTLDEDGDLALAFAVSEGSLDIVKLLLEKGAKVNTILPGYLYTWEGAVSILGLAALEGNVPITRLLLEYGAEVNLDLEDSIIPPLACAVEHDKMDVVEILLSAGAKVQFADDAGLNTLVEQAVMNSNLELCRILIAAGAKVNRPPRAGKYQTSALCIAAEKNNVEIAEFLVVLGARVNDLYSQAPGTALEAAIEAGNITMIDLLRQCGATYVGHDLRQIGNKETAVYLQQVGLLENILSIWGDEILIASIQTRSHGLTEYLLNYWTYHFHFDNCASRQGITPLEAAISSGNIALARVLMNFRTQVTDHELNAAVWEALYLKRPGILPDLLKLFDGRAATAVYMAVERKDENMVEFLLQSGVDPRGKLFEPRWIWGKNHRKSAGWWHETHCESSSESVLEYAIRMRMPKIATYLLQSTHWPPTLTGRALAYSIRGGLELFESLLQAGADVNQDPVECYGEDLGTPIQAAVKIQNTGLVRRLITAGADIHYLGPCDGRRTPLQCAVELGNTELVNLLLQANANVNGPISEDGGATALQLAAIQGFLDIARELISAGADINADPAAKNGRTALEGAAEHGRIDMLQFLLNEGAAIEGTGERQYNRAVKFAEKNGHYAAARLLKRHKMPIV